jgi:SAM-dependent methyltransferase
MAPLLARKARVVGCDLNPSLLKLARRRGSVVRTRLPDLSWARPNSFDGALVGLVLEHLEDEASFFRQVAQAVKRRGTLALVINHPIWTAPDSSPIEDSAGETLWRPGTYFKRGYSDEPAGQSRVRFYHRTLAELLNAASDAGWDLRQVIECGVSNEQIARVPDYAGQEHIPRILGVRWSKR